ncbi:unnamed protein product [Urochloa decumbens]|uniref:At1g61320/AtMIF1 LRR domain-containing protein n=1 Tax=Urochloa decumbens TaxID=240449 RepID=A0ABC8VN97_9POAL
MMDGRHPQPCAGGGDRLSKLGDRELGNILSFLPAKEAARAALLSSRWRDRFAAVHTVSLDEPEPPPAGRQRRQLRQLQLEANALLARNRRGGGAPLRALRVAMEYGGGAHSSTVDQWVSHAVQHAAPGGLRLDLRLRRVPLCERRPYSLLQRSGGQKPDADGKYQHGMGSFPPHGRGMSPSPSCSMSPSRSPSRSTSPSRSRSPPRSTSPRSRSPSRSTSPSRSPSPSRSRSRSPSRTMSRSPSPRRLSYSPSPRACRRRRRASSDIGSDWSDDDEPPPQRQRRRSISSNEGPPDPVPGPQRQGSESRDSDYAGDRSLSPQKRSATRSRRSDSYDRSPSPSSSSSDDNVACDKKAARRDEESPRLRDRELTVSTVLFTCAALRSLSLGHFRLALPAKVNLPSLEALLLSHVSGTGTRVERIIAGSPRLADLTLEACQGVVRLCVPSVARLRRLALRCCHNLAAVVLDASELVAFEYRGAVPDTTFLTTMNDGASPKAAYCKVDICGQEVSSEEVAKLAHLLQMFPNAKRLHLESARLGSGIDKDVPMNFPTLSGLRHLELRGRLPDDDTVLVGAMSRILGHTPNLQALSLIFHPEPPYGLSAGLSYIRHYNEVELLDAHSLKYNGQSVLATASCSTIPCLRNSVREINLVHYQGGRAQRALAKFLLCNAPAIDELWCEFAEGPLWTQTQLMSEIKGWVTNKSAKTHFL